MMKRALMAGILGAIVGACGDGVSPAALRDATVAELVPIVEARDAPAAEAAAKGLRDGGAPAASCASAVRPGVPSVAFFWVGQEASGTMKLTWEGNICAGLTVDADVPWARGALVGGALRVELVSALVPGGVHRGRVRVRDVTGRALTFVDVELRALGTARADAAPKVLVIGIDGVRGDAMEGATLPELRSLLRHAAASFHASAQRTGPTSSGPGWTSIFTGVGPDHHHIVTNGGYPGRDRTWPSFVWRAHEALGLRTAVASQWADIVAGIVEPEAVDVRAIGDGATVSATMARWLRAAGHDVHFVHFDDVDHAGHASGFSLANPAYRGALEGVDRLVRPLLDAIVERPSIAGERWLVVVCTDHGGAGTSHGALNPDNWDIPLFVAGPTVVPTMPAGFVSHMDVHPTVMRFLGAPPPAAWRLDGRPLGVAYETACADGRDDDGDERVDCGDADCAAEARCSCARDDAGSRLGRAVFSGTTAGASHRLSASCGRGAAPERLVRWTAPRAGAYTFDLTGSARDFDTVLAVLRGECEGAEAACNDDASGLQSAVRVTVAAGERLTLLIEGKGAATGAFQLNVEAADACPDRDLASATGDGAASGVIGDTGGTFFASCGRSGRDVLLRWRAPAAGTWRFDTAGSGYDTVLHLRDGDCAGAELACSDDVAGGGYTSQLSAPLREGQVVTVVLSGFNGRPEGTGPLPGGGNGQWVLNINR